MKQNTMRKQNPPLGQVLYLKDYIPAEQAPEWLEKVSIWTENLAGTAMTVLSVGWMWYCMVCV